MKVSIIVPVYNVEKYLEKCLDSIVNQTYKNLEIIIVNDGSPDNSQYIIDRFSKKDKRIKSFSKKNGGLSSSRNFGMKKATGDYIMFLDSDDYFELNMIEDMISAITKDDSDLCICDFTVEGETGALIKKGYEFDKSTINNALISLPSACNKLFKREKFIYNFPEKMYYEDLGTIPRVIAKCTSVSYINKGYYHYIQRQGSIMNQEKFNEKLKDIFFIMDILYSDNNFNHKFNDELEFLYIKHLLHDASLRFLKYNEKSAKESLNKIVKEMKEKYPNWTKNKYLSNLSRKELNLTKMLYRKMYWIYKIYRKVCEL